MSSDDIEATCAARVDTNAVDDDEREQSADGRDDGQDGDDDQAPRRAPPPTRGEAASPTPVAVQWASGKRCGFAHGNALVAFVRNTGSSVLRVDLAATAFGLDERTASRPLSTIDVPPHRRVALRIRFSDLPIQSVGTQSQIILEARAESGGPLVASPPIHYEFSNDFRSITLYGFAGKDSTVATSSALSDPTAFIDSVRASADAAFAVVGRVFDPKSGGMVDVNQLPPRTIGTALIHQTYALNGPRSAALDRFPPGAFGPRIPVDPRPGNPSDFYQLCATWKARFVDAGFGEDFAASSALQDLPARFARATVVARGASRAVYDGVLDENGCTPPLHLPSGDYFLAQSSSMSVDCTVKIDVSYGAFDPRNPGSQPGSGGGNAPAPWGLTLLTAFSVQGARGLERVDIQPSYTDYATRVSAVMGQVLATPDNGFRNLLDCVGVVPTLRVRANQLCPNGGEACYDPKTDFTYIGPNGMGPHNSEYKYVVAHEFGHHVQHATMGLPFYDYARSPGLPALCDCAHVTGGFNRIHCLQSRQQDMAAQVEAFAHFYASKTWNDRARSGCTFVYYKEFLQPNNTVLVPPFARDCRAPQLWMENNCGNADTHQGVEWDWLNFLYTVNTASTAQVTYDNFTTIYRTACGGRACDYNSFDTTHWEQLVAGAQSAFGGVNDPRFRSFTDNGRIYGVSH